MNSIKAWMLWLVLNLSIAGYLAYALMAPASTIKTTLLPGRTTHGHYQIELDCDACHAESTEAASAGNFAATGPLMQDACNRCHGEQLRLANDTHPAAKFNDPTNADRLLILDAQNCVTCHREHVPEQTLAMGLTLPADYCWHCHQEIGDTRSSHQGMAYDSCATAGCHNYHDNRALYEKFLEQHAGEADVFENAINPQRNLVERWRQRHPELTALDMADADGPRDREFAGELIRDWAETAHARADVNCRGCHELADQASPAEPWRDEVAMASCQQCHEAQTESFVAGRHGMRLASSLSPMTPAQARLPMHAGAAHRELTCTACHAGHRFDTQFAAVDACLQCHADSHTLAFNDSPHAELWRSELAGAADRGTGVSCATCHLPRLSDGGRVWVNHDQNANLRPNETMARDVCRNCHGLEFSLSALADPQSIASCFATAPKQRVESVEMARSWFEQQAAKRQQRTAAP